MKIFKSVVFICLFSFVVIPACIKNTVTVDYAGPNKNPVILLPKDTVKRGEPIVVSTTVQDPNTIIKWAIRPSLGTALIPNGNEVTINISLAGTYLLTANFYSLTNTVTAYDSTHSTIHVSDSVYVPPSGSNIVPLTDKEITLTPQAFSSILVILATTTSKFNCGSIITSLGITQPAAGPTSTIMIYFDSATVTIDRAGCGGVKDPATSNIFLSPLDNGTHPFYVILNQVTYQGSVLVTDSNFTFTWPYTSGIILSPKQIKKN
jgi:hypothetical protein